MLLRLKDKDHPDDMTSSRKIGNFVDQQPALSNNQPQATINMAAVNQHTTIFHKKKPASVASKDLSVNLRLHDANQKY